MSQHSDKGVTRGQALCHTAVSQHTVAAHCHNKLSQHTVTASGPPQPCPACLRQTKCTIADPFSGWNKQFPRNVYREDSSTPAEGHGFRGMHSGGMRYKKDLDSRGHPSKGPDFRDLYSRGHALQKGPGFRKKSPRDALSIPGALRPHSRRQKISIELQQNLSDSGPCGQPRTCRRHFPAPPA